MNPIPAKPAAAPATRWALEVARGKEPGRAYLLETGETILGNAPDRAHVLNLASQEGSALKRLASRHAVLSSSAQELTIRDLESPGGTFVNSQRLLSGQARRLEPGDVIQLGGLQLRVKQENAATAPPVAPIKSSATAPASQTPEKVNPGGVSTGPPAGQTPGKPAQRAAAGGPSPLPAFKAPGVAAVAAAAASPASPSRLPVAFTMAGGAQCRTWDDFLVLAAQRWSSLRDELMSGRLAEYLRRIQRPELVPHITPDRSADDQLDEWLARLPASAKSAPELDVHPESLIIRAKTGGAIAGQSLRVANVGYRLLRWTARIEPPDAPWLRLRPGHDHRPIQTIEQTELPVELELPETIDRPLRGLIVIESNGGTRRVEVRVERPAEQLVIPAGASAGIVASPAWGGRLLGKAARLGLVARLAGGCLVAVALRLLVVIMNVIPIGRGTAGLLEPRLVSVSVVLSAAGVLLGLALVRGRGEVRDLPAAAFAGAALGLLTAAFWFAAVQSLEKILGSWSHSIGALVVFWGAVGALCALASMIFIPHRDDAREALP